MFIWRHAPPDYPIQSFFMYFYSVQTHDLMFQTTRDDEAALVSFCAASTALLVSVAREVSVMHAETSLWSQYFLYPTRAVKVQR